MKKLTIITSLLALTACGGGSISTPEVNAPINQMTIRQANNKVIGIDVALTTSAELVQYAEAKIPGLVDSEYVPSSEQRSSRPQTNISLENRYLRALAQYKNMYNIAQLDSVSEKSDDLKNAYLLSNESADDYDSKSANEILSDIKSNYNTVLTKYFTAYGDTDSKWEYKTLQKLSDVRFLLGPASDEATGGIRYITFGLNDKGLIDNAKVTEGDKVIIDANRSGTTNTFTDASGNSYKITSASDNKLSYSDFGHIDLLGQAGQGATTRAVFAGGYSEKEIKKEKINTNLTFTGTATATANYEYQPDQSAKVSGIKNMENGTATLTFNTATKSEKLDMDFGNDYYHVTMERNSGNKATITFDDTGKNIDTHYQFENTTVSDGILPDGFASAHTAYYGTTATPSEAVGTVHYRESIGDKKVFFEGAFGVQATPQDN